MHNPLNRFFSLIGRARFSQNNPIPPDDSPATLSLVPAVVDRPGLLSAYNQVYLLRSHTDRVTYTVVA